MENFDLEKLEKLLSEEKYGEAKELLEGFFAGDITPEERGAVYANLAMVYLRVNNEINKKYLEELKNTIVSLKEIDRIEQEGGDKADIADVKNRINQL